MRPRHALLLLPLLAAPVRAAVEFVEEETELPAAASPAPEAQPAQAQAALPSGAEPAPGAEPSGPQTDPGAESTSGASPVPGTQTAGTTPDPGAEPAGAPNAMTTAPDSLASQCGAPGETMVPLRTTLLIAIPAALLLALFGFLAGGSVIP